MGDVLEYKVTIPNSGTSTAFDANIVDTLPANVALVAGSATATINGVAVTGFVANPATPSGTTLVWGRGNGDGSLDIPAAPVAGAHLSGDGGGRLLGELLHQQRLCGLDLAR